MSDETTQKRKRQPRLNENQRHMIEYLWNIEKMTQADIARRLGYTPSSILRELHRGNTLDFSHLDRRTLLNMDIHARIKYSAQRGQYIALKKRSKMGTGLKLTPELKEIIETWVNVEHWTPEQIAGNVQDVDVSASVIRLWSRQGLINIRKQKYHRQNGTPSQRGTNERLNRELRRIYPVGYNFTKITQKRLQESIRNLNRRPRHVLGYQTPEHEFVRRMNEITQKTTIAASI